MANYSGRVRPTAEIVRNKYDYDPATGIFKHRRRVCGRRSHHPSGVGGIDAYGYHRLSVNGRQYKAHIIAWLFCYGEWPDGEIDHINGIRDDNRIANLRVCTHQQNQANRPMQSNNTSGAKGVCVMRLSGGRVRYLARVCKDKKHRIIGHFDTLEDAAQAYADAAAKIHGAFARST